MNTDSLSTIVRGICSSALNCCMSNEELEAVVEIHKPIIQARELLILSLAMGIDKPFADRLKDELRQIDGT